MSKIKFTVYGKPFGWQRAGQNHYTKVTYTPQQTRAYEQNVAWGYKLAARGFKFPPKTYIGLDITAYYPIPKSATKAERAGMLDGSIRPAIKPDWDNIGKLVSDALNNIAYDDDKSVVDGLVRKFYSDNPRTEIIVTDLV